MKYYITAYIIAFSGLASASPTPSAAPKNVWTISLPRAMLRSREVPQEHSHDRFLDGIRVNLALDNPNNIQDPVFGLLGNAAAAGGAGKITNLDCLHQATADQAFTNAKAAGNITGQADALMYAALERNTGKVGLASVACNEAAVNPEIAAVQQHQDPASLGAAAGNKAIVLALAKQLASIGVDPQEALLSGTFAPGDLTDNTAKGNTCDSLNDPKGGCIFSQNLLIDDATAAEISAAAAGILSGSSVTSSSPASVTTTSIIGISSSPSNKIDTGCSVTFVTVTSGSVPTSTISNTTASTATALAESLDFGSCSRPAILFENGLDGRTQPAFIAANQHDFNHGSALNIAVIAGFICQRFGSPCKASTDAVAACNAGTAAAAAAGGTVQAAADAFNAALGVSASISTSSSMTMSAIEASNTASSMASSAPVNAAASGTNVQTFAGALGGLAPAVTQSSTGDRPFSVNGDTFVNKAAALQRSCSVQNNACSDAVNGGRLLGTSVADCGEQEEACNTAAASA